MSLLQIGLNILFGVLAFAVARHALALVGFNEGFGWLISVIIGVGVFFANFAARITTRR